MIDSEEIKSEDQIKLVGALIDKKLSYNEYILIYFKQASSKLYSIKQLGNFIAKHKKSCMALWKH